MTERHVKDLAASIRQRLYNHARTTDRPFQEVLQYFAMERFLYRLSQSRHADKFILKGALLFSIWRAPCSRPTKDIDLLARTSNNVEAIVSIIRDVCLLDVEPDGLVFDDASLQGATITEEADYEGVRITFLSHLQNAKIHMQLDMGFGDVLATPAAMTQYPTILAMTPPRLLSYNRETAIAEKFETMVKLGFVNSRMKDFFDIWLLSRQFGFDGLLLGDAIARTLSHRRTDLVLPLYVLTPDFATDPVKAKQWQAFLRKSRITMAPGNLLDVINDLSTFLLPVVRALCDQRNFSASWNPPGPWQATDG